MKKNKLRIVNKFRFVSTLTLILLMLFFSINAVFHFTVAEGGIEQRFVEMHIKEGDTIWKLAQKYTPEGEDIRKTIYEIGIANDMRTYDIYPGQVIKIPIR
ncbi:MAG: LysM peptidoglycan-binding domain-containing protein [Bacillota bacterium]